LLRVHFISVLFLIYFTALSKQAKTSPRHVLTCTRLSVERPCAHQRIRPLQWTVRRDSTWDMRYFWGPWLFELKIRAPFAPAVGAYTPIWVFYVLFLFSSWEPVRDKQTDRWTGRTRNAAY